ncbi:cell division protein FtsA [Aerococcus urinae]|uniref:Cell division protein FtsA n=1 Tax=Aerococcus urinae TaxID=1376 RepID=A0A120I9P0_9LACT|nr:cell division protein FtsA [Aerococcus urinae]AMB95528.1 cell division protein FtsA [Aerococcus urinae]MCY3032612.1 cell division protein FtsA [Aerococcus urinae]MCY3037913.1 cell division protein FtsA [Aerococcus urinae]MCY3044658.1 cell division protein FtsA [Aerococcus urinae]MCY3045795.1 cell division protein FtsA [Aerococcus urinae]
MVQPKTYVGLDIGTTSVKVVVAENVNQRLNIIGVGSQRSEGLSRGVIVDIDKTVEAIRSAVNQAEQKANIQIDRVVVGVPSNQINIEPCYGMIAVSGENREITDKDVYNVLSAAKVRAVPPEREIISVVPEEFIVDGFDGIRDPRGMIGVRLELYASMITGPKTIIHNIKRCVDKAGLIVDDLVVQPLANGQVALSEDERDFGTIIIDMGGGQSTASVIHEGQLKFSYVDQEGGEYVSKDISTILNTTLENAERIKLEYGYAKSDVTSPDEYFPVETIGKKDPVRVDEQYLAEIIEARLQQIIETLKKALDQVEAFELPGGVVITGGAASLPGLVDLAEEMFGTDVRFYIPEQVGLRNPSFTTAYGVVAYAAKLPDIYHVAQGKTHSVNSNQSKPSYQASNQALHQEAVVDEPTYKDSVTNDERDVYATAEDAGQEYQDDNQEDEGFLQKIRQVFDDMFS